MTDINYADVKIAILENIQNNRSTGEVSKSLGFSFDQFKRWLDHSKILRWDEFCDMCEKSNLELKQALSGLLFPMEPFSQPKDFFAFVKIRNGFETNQEIASYLNCHVSVVKRYCYGETIPDVETIFKMIDFRKNSFAGFLKHLFSGDAKNSLLNKLIAEGIKGSEFTGRAYIFAMIEAAVSTQKYRARKNSTVDWLSQQLKISVSEVELHLNSMLNAKTLVKHADDTYQVSDLTTNLQNTLAEAIPFYQDLGRHLVQHLQDKKMDPNPAMRPGVISQRVYATSVQTAQKINLVIMKAGAEILKILEESPDESEIAFSMIMSVFPITESEKADT